MLSDALEHPPLQPIQPELRRLRDRHHRHDPGLHGIGDHQIRRVRHAPRHVEAHDEQPLLARFDQNVGDLDRQALGVLEVRVLRAAATVGEGNVERRQTIEVLALERRAVGTRVYIPTGGGVAVFDTATDVQIDSIDLGIHPGGIAVSPTTGRE